jgi:hypothetical protein
MKEILFTQDCQSHHTHMFIDHDYNGPFQYEEDKYYGFKVFKSINECDICNKDDDDEER